MLLLEKEQELSKVQVELEKLQPFKVFVSPYTLCACIIILYMYIHVHVYNTTVHVNEHKLMLQSISEDVMCM